MAFRPEESFHNPGYVAEPEKDFTTDLRNGGNKGNQEKRGREKRMLRYLSCREIPCPKNPATVLPE
jgi:hypothetical protein